MENQVLNSEPKWEAKFTATIKQASSDKIWSFFEDFFGFDKWFPGLTACYGIHGNNNEPGSIRYCAGEHRSDGGETVVHWAKERLNTIDKNEKLITYEFLENSVGFTNFVASFKVKDGDEEGGCVIEWSISLDPVEGLKFEDMMRMNEVRLQQIAEKMELAAALNG